MNTVLLVNHSMIRCGVHMFGDEIASQLSGATRYRFHTVECNSATDLASALAQHTPSAVIFNFHPTTLPWAPLASTLCWDIPTIGIMHDVTDAMADAWEAPSFDMFITHDPNLKTRNDRFVGAPRPIPQVHASGQSADDGVVRIGSFGFASPDKGFPELVQLAEQSFERCVVRLHIPPSDFGDPEGIAARRMIEQCRASITRPGVEVEGSHGFLDRDELIELLASNDLNALLYEPDRGLGGISSAGDWLLAAGKPMALRRGKMFRNYDLANPSIFVDDLRLDQILANGTWTPAALVEAYEGVVDSALARFQAGRESNPAFLIERSLTTIKAAEAFHASHEEEQRQQNAFRTKRLQEFEGVFHQLETDRRHLSERIEQISAAHTQLSSSHAALSEAHGVLQQRNQETNERLASAMREVTRLHEAASDLQNALSSLEQDSNRLRQEGERLHGEVTHRQTEIGRLVDELGRAHEEINRRELEIGRLQAELRWLPVRVAAWSRRRLRRLGGRGAG